MHVIQYYQLRPVIGCCGKDVVKRLAGDQVLDIRRQPAVIHGFHAQMLRKRSGEKRLPIAMLPYEECGLVREILRMPFPEEFDDVINAIPPVLFEISLLQQRIEVRIPPCFFHHFLVHANPLDLKL